MLSADPPDIGILKYSLDDIILGSDAERYNKYIYNENITQFTYGSNIYRYYSDGYLKYRYLGNAEQNSRARAADALLNAYQFIAKTEWIYDSDAELKLTSVKKRAGGIYEFGFDYRIGGMPVKIDYEMKDSNSGRLRHAVIILADSKRVLECDWLIRNIRQIGSIMYNDRMLELLGKEKILFEDINIRQINTGFCIDDTQKDVLEPILIIETKENDPILLDLLPEEGE